MSESTTEVQALTATVRVIEMEGRRLTAGMFGQLDEVDCDSIQPLGRVNDKKSYEDSCVVVVGRDAETGVLVRSSLNHSCAYELQQEMVNEELASLLLMEFDPERHSNSAHRTEEAFLAERDRRIKTAKVKIKIKAGLSRAAQEWEALPLLILAGSE